MKVGCSTWSFDKFFQAKKIDLKQFITTVAELGVQGVELCDAYFSERFGGPGIPPPDGYLKELKETAASSGIEIAAICWTAGPLMRNLEDKKKRSKNLKMWTEIGGKLEISAMRVTTGWQAETVPYVTQVHWVRDVFKDCVKAAEKNDIVYAIEPHDVICKSAEGVIWLIESVGSERLRACPDPLNWGISRVMLIPGEKPVADEAIYVETERIAPYAAHAHAKMSTFDENGEVYTINPVTKEKWHMDYQRIINIFRKAGYEGYQSMEIYGEGQQTPIESVKKGAILLKKYI